MAVLPSGKTMNDIVSDVRCLLRDYPELNRLLELQDGQESTDGQIRLAVRIILDDWDVTPPLINAQIPFGILLKGSAAETLKSACAFYGRNRINYNTGGTAVSVEDKYQEMKNLADDWYRDYEVKKRNFKTAVNAEGAYGEAPSEYAFIPSNNY